MTRKSSKLVKRKSDANKNRREKIPSISYFTLYRFASRWDILLIFIAAFASFIAGVTLPYAITLVASVFQSMIDHAKSVQDGTHDEATFLRNVHEYAIKYSCVGVALFFGGFLGTALMGMTAINQIFNIRVAYVKAALNQDFGYFDLHQTGDFAAKMAEDIIKVEEGIGDKVSSLVYNTAVVISCISMAMIKGWKLALLCLTTAPITFMLVGVTGMIANRLYKKQAQAKAEASSVAEEAISSIRTVYAFSGQDKEIERYKSPLKEARSLHIKKEFFTGMSMGFLFLCIFSSYALAFYVGVYLVINDTRSYNADVMFAVFFGVMTALGNLGMLGSLMSSFGTARGAGAQIFHVIDNVPTINPLLDRGIKPAIITGTIEFKDVSFHYPSRPEVPVLKNLNIKVLSGQSVALVGQSGCGKSTVVNLISRFYDVNSGNVLVDENDVRELSVKWLRSQIGLVDQQPVLFSTSIRENIRHGREDASDVEIEQAAMQANAHHFIMKLPIGYDTLVGERGASLSGGQKQRIAIARALVRNPRLLLLDEATSALDTGSEAKVQKALDEVAKGRTTIIVAHRLSTIRNVDVIHVLKDGQVVESGSHSELLDKKGTYYEMFSISELPYMTQDSSAQAERDSLRENSIILNQNLRDSIIEVDEKMPPKERLSFWGTLKLNAPEWKSITLGSVCSIICGFSMPLFIVAFGDLFGAMSNPDPQHLMNKVETVAMACVCIGFAMGVSNFIETLSFGLAGAYLTERLRYKMFVHILKQHIGYFDQRANSTGALCTRLSAEAAYVQGATGHRIGVILQGVGSIGLAIVLAMLFEWRVGLVALCYLPVIIFVIWQQGKATNKESSGYALALENSTKVAVEAISNIRTVASLGLEDGVVRAVANPLKEAKALGRRAARWRGIATGLSRSIFNFINATALTYGAHLIVSDGIDYQNVLITTQSLQMASNQAQNAFGYAPEFQKGMNSASRIVKLLGTEPKIVDPENPITDFKAKGEANFQDVEFTYPNRPTEKVLRGLNLQIEIGKTIALVGQSGCGKSTIIQLLERYYEADSGIIALDGVSVTQLRLNDLRASFGLVSQEPVLFDRTVRENIMYGDNSRIVTDEEIKQAAKQANIHSFIETLPEGYETLLGSRGVQLSGGQRQRVAIARALIRYPKILLLDEATSALDSENEKVVQAALDDAKAGRTCLMIAHRLSTVRDADAICVLRNGRIAERGTHHTLMQLKGLYYNLHLQGL